MTELKSFVCGKWVAGRGPGATLVNPATEAPVATASSDGVDFGETLAYARKGGARLRAMTFRERGEILRGMSRAIHSHRDELIGLAIVNGGNTRSDAKFDIDGASGTLAAYADFAAELGDTRVVIDGEPAAIGRSARLVGQHAYVPREGVAVHINAFNFPAWGLAEKGAVALLAGMPVVSKPGTSTALVAHRLVEIFEAEKLIEGGIFSFIAGSAGDMLDRLGGQDVLAFTGGSATGTKLRGTSAILANSVRVNVEADSLNATVLGPDVESGSDVMNLFIADVVRDMSQKTGQKCTAIRRVYVPSAMVAEVIERIQERLLAIKVGDPSRDDVNMGPLATAQQLADVREGLFRLETCSRVVCGGKAPAEPLGGTPGKGFFLLPTLLHSDSPSLTNAIHSHEVFGPVATVVSYDGTAEGAVRFVAAGGGGLVSSIYSDDKDFLRGVVLGIAPFHGRVTIGSSKIAAQAMPPGLVLPQLVHGGPGRAGGGEELGARRGLAFYQQRLALQGDRPLIESILGQR